MFNYINSIHDFKCKSKKYDLQFFMLKGSYSAVGELIPEKWIFTIFCGVKKYFRCAMMLVDLFFEDSLAWPNGISKRINSADVWVVPERR
jgi:hypothetical protein